MIYDIWYPSDKTTRKLKIDETAGTNRNRFRLLRLPLEIAEYLSIPKLEFFAADLAFSFFSFSYFLPCSLSIHVRVCALPCDQHRYSTCENIEFRNLSVTGAPVQESGFSWMMETMWIYVSSSRIIHEKIAENKSSVTIRETEIWGKSERGRVSLAVISFRERYYTSRVLVLKLTKLLAREKRVQIVLYCPRDMLAETEDVSCRLINSFTLDPWISRFYKACT